MSAGLRVRAYSSEYLGDLVGLFNAQMAHLPYVWPITVDEFRRGVIEMAAPRGRELPFDPEALKIAFRKGKPVAYAHAMQLPEPETGQSGRGGQGAICFFCVEPDDIEAGQALIAACRSYLLQQGLTLDVAWPVVYTYRFVQGGKGQVMEDSHLAKVLLSLGWRPAQREHLMSLDLYPPGELMKARVEIVIRRSEPRNRFRNHRVEAWIGDKRVGHVTWREMSQASMHPDASTVCYVASVETHPEFRRLGIGSCLMSQAAEDMRIAGQKHSWLYTNVNNAGGIGLYSSVGWKSRGIAASYSPGDSDTV